MAQEYQVKGQWTDTAAGRVYEAKAVGKTGRILGVVRVDVPVEVGFDLATYYGNQLSEELIVQAADGLADRFGMAAP